MISYSSLKENCFFKEIYILSNTSFEAGRFEKKYVKNVKYYKHCSKI